MRRCASTRRAWAWSRSSTASWTRRTCDTVLGLDHDSIRVVYLRIPGGGFVELLEYRGIERLSAASRPCDYGAGHLCLYVDDVEQMHARLVSLGFHARSEQVVDITAGPNAGARSCYMADPDGYAVELFQKRPGA